jgi:hypothetical protein
MYTKTTIRPIILHGLIALIAIMAIAIAVAPASCAIHHSGGNADLVITVNELSPQPVEPGRDLVLSVTLDNRGGGVASGIVLTIMPDSRIILKNENARIM